MQKHSGSTRNDLRILNALLLKLRMPGWLWRGAVLIIALIVWIWICQRILFFGSLLHYEGLQTLGPEVVSLFTKVNPYLWWSVVVILTLIVLSIVRSWLIRANRNARARLVSVGQMQHLCDNLSQESLEVLQWVWQPDLDPVTVGDLLTTRQEIRADRSRRLNMARAQRQALEKTLSGQPLTPDDFVLPKELPQPERRVTDRPDKIEPIL